MQSADVNDDGVANTADVTRLQASLGRSCGQTNFNPNADVNNDCTVNALDLGFVSRNAGLPVPRQPRLSQGATLAIEPQTGALQVAWRQFNDGVLPDAIVTVRSTNGGATVSAPTVVATLGSFDQGTSGTSFRTNAYPTMAYDAAGRVYLAWSSRGFAAQRPDPSFGDARVVMSTSTNGTTWAMPTAVDNAAEPGHQVMPALTFAQGKLQLVYYDLREDVSQLFGQYVDELPILSGVHLPRLRHTIEVRAAQADPGASPSFSGFRLTQYRSGAAPGAQTVQQLEFNPPNLPIFRAGTSPFMGDYIDVATEAPFAFDGTRWLFNTAATASPVFHGIWTDNRDIRPPANGLWTDYTPPNPPFARPAMSAFDPTQPIPACVPGQAGMRNQNIYTARITRGLVVGSLGNSRRLGSIQRSFPVFAQNNSTAIRSYRLTIANQPVGGQASFKQFEQLVTLDVRVPPRSTVARTVFARSSDPHAPINVSVVEISAPGGAPVTGGQRGTIALNPDPTNPELENPELENPELENPELENAEVHNPDLETPTVRNPELENPELENPELENPELENATAANPSILNPELENPELENPELENPELENPELENVNLANGSLSDTTWTITNKGNTAGAYTVKLGLNRQLPIGFKSQLIAHKLYRTPVVLGCSLLKQTQTVLLANIPSPRFVTADEFLNPELENPELENLTIAIAPGETARITLRVFDPDKRDAVTFRAAENVTPVAVAQAVNTLEADAGGTQPAVAGVLTSSAPVPGGTSGGDYTTTLTSTLPGTWTVAGGTVPPGLTVNAATGGITGTPTTPGTYTFTARFQSTIGIIDYRAVTITVGAVGADANVGVAATGPGAPVAIGTPFAYTLNVSNAGPAAASNVRLTDTLPEGTQFVSATTTAGTCQHANGTLLCNLGALGSGAAATIVLNVRPTVGGTHTNRAVVSADQADPVATNNAAVSTATSAGVTPCTTVCFSGPTSYLAGPADPEFGGEKGDFNGDGFVDLIFGPAGVNTVGIMLANGAGGFGPPSLIPIPGTPNGAAVADYNNDGHQDVVISSERTAEAWVLLGNGLGQFGAPAIVALPTEPQNVVAADFNRDGNVDLALAGDTGPLVMILHGNGNGTFQPTTTIGTTTTFSTVVTDDVNNDTNPDLVVHQEEVGLVIILGNGAAGFQPPTTIPITDISGIIKTGDLTGDGFADLILGSVPSTGAELHLYVGDGLGGFTRSVMIGDPALTDGAPAVGDLDSDGDLDVVWGRSGGGVAIQLNNGSGTFAAAIYLASPQVGQILVADYNGDGRPDLALPIEDAPQSQFLVFLNTCDQPPADVQITLVPPAGPVLEGENFAYNVAAVNNGPNAAIGVQLDFTFGASAAFVSVGGAGSCSVAGTRVTCQVGTLASGAAAAFTIVVQPRASHTLPSTAGVTALTSDPNPGNNAAFASTTVTPGASTLVVTNTNRSGPGSLYQAIVDANDPGPRDTITFNIPGPGPHTIAPTGDLPDITQPVVIDGTTQPDYAGTPLIEINGQNAGTAFGLVVNGSNSIVRGLAINRFHHVGIVLSGAGGHRLEANFIGTNTSGTAALGNLEQGVFISSPNNVIGGATAAERNVISGNTAQGVIILGAAATGNVVSGNFIGSNVSGTARIPNGGAGVAVINGASDNTIGGTTAGAGNLISGNTGPGVTINTAGTTRNTVAGNLIGVNAAGSAALFNGNSGVVLNTGTTNNTVGGTTTAARNVISGNNQSGVSVSGAGTSGNTVAGNHIGTNAAGSAAVANGNNGITINGSATNNTIGGTSAGAGNVISGNPVQGIAINTAGTSGNAVVGNFIGTNAAGTAAVANGHGISVSGAATNNTI
ncbi:MAG TPA: FG-GAP-like repeat-containing protein, partial [Desertimonas sp.]|nr:FG-GAP-like repeat-containing protein [Desertimonas sp.]